MFGSLAKWVEQIEDPSRIPEIMSRAFHTATNGRAGPVVVALPEDMLTECARVGDTAPYQQVEPSPGALELEELERLVTGCPTAARDYWGAWLVSRRPQSISPVRFPLGLAGRGRVSLSGQF